MISPARTNEAIFAIVTPNYLPQAENLMRSVRAHSKDTALLILVVGSAKPIVASDKNFCTIIDYAKWAKDDPQLLNLAFQYTPFQLCCAIKPYAAKKIMRDYEFKKLIYLDADILCFSPFDFVFKSLEQAPFILTPHLVDPSKTLNDGRFPQENTIIASGTFNMGFFATAANEEAIQILDWWQARTFYRCEQNIPAGIFVDQKWADLIPGLFPKTALLRHPGCNVAYWNLHERQPTLSKKNWTCKGQPLVFYHFSGWSPSSPTTLSAHQNRYNFYNQPDLAKIYAQYAMGFSSKEQFHSRDGYLYSQFSNGAKILPILRALYRQAEPLGIANFGDPFQAHTEGSFFSWILDPGEEHVTPLALGLRSIRPDVIKQMPYPSNIHKHLEIQDWAASHGIKEIYNDSVWAKLLTVATARGKGQIKVASELRKSRIPKGNAPAVGFGVNLIGFKGSEKGMGASYRRSAECLRTANIPIVEGVLNDIHSLNPYKTSSKPWTASYSTNLIHVNPEDLEVFVQNSPTPIVGGRLNIGYWAWELQDFPKKYFHWFQYFDEIWVPSRFVQSAIAPHSPVPVVTVPHAISEAWSQIPQNVNKSDFKFLTIFDFDSAFERKNPLATVKSFKKAFSKRDNVKLVLKTIRGEKYPSQKKLLLNEIAGDKRIEWIDAIQPQEQLQQLMASASCFISLHRSEGFGLTIQEAMAYELPVIATDYSGSCDFVSGSTGLPVKYNLTKVGKGAPPYNPNSMWADPSTDDAAEKMRFVFNNPTQAKELAAQAKQHILRNFSITAVSKIYLERLRILRAKRPTYG